MISIDISADTPEEALAEGLRQLGVSREAVETQLLSSAHDDTLPGAEPLPGVTVRLTVNDSYLVDAAKAHLLKILEIIGVQAHLEVLRRRGGYVLNIHAGDDDSLIIGKNGQNLEALQICVNRMVVHGGRDLLPIYVDCANYMDKRLGRLESTAERSARRASREGTEVALEPMTPFERKIVHNALKEIKGLHTISRGEGLERHIVIVPDEDNMDRKLRPRRGAPQATTPADRRSRNEDIEPLGD
jgi:spoIIIJ-associated protein